MASSQPGEVADPDDPVGYFLEDLRYHGKSDRTRDAYERVLREFETFLDEPGRNPRGEPLAPSEATARGSCARSCGTPPRASAAPCRWSCRARCGWRTGGRTPRRCCWATTTSAEPSSIATRSALVS
jgi:hypothetical protein